MENIWVIAASLLWFIGSILFYLAWLDGRLTQPEQKPDWGFILSPFWFIAVFVWLIFRYIERERNEIKK
ncbi:MAG: hypothetical protein WEC39_02495 [Patescibacteria group bacterium]